MFSGASNAASAAASTAANSGSVAGYSLKRPTQPRRGNPPGQPMMSQQQQQQGVGQQQQLPTMQQQQQQMMMMGGAGGGMMMPLGGGMTPQFSFPGMMPFNHMPVMPANGGMMPSNVSTAAASAGIRQQQQKTSSNTNAASSSSSIPLPFGVGMNPTPYAPMTSNGMMLGQTTPMPFGGSLPSGAASAQPWNPSSASMMKSAATSASTVKVDLGGASSGKKMETTGSDRSDSPLRDFSREIAAFRPPSPPSPVSNSNTNTASSGSTKAVPTTTSSNDLVNSLLPAGVGSSQPMADVNSGSAVNLSALLQLVRPSE